jgi:anti-anti-sigma factor
MAEEVAGMEAAPGAGDGRSDSAPFTVDVRSVSGVTVLALGGELDHDTADLLRDALDQAIHAGSARLLVDCGELRFCDSTGLNTLLRARQAAEAAGAALDLADLHGAIARLFEITGADGVFRTFATVDEALAGN